MLVRALLAVGFAAAASGGAFAQAVPAAVASCDPAVTTELQVILRPHSCEFLSNNGTANRGPHMKLPC